MWREDEDRRQMKPSLSELREEDRETPARSRGVDPLRGYILGELELPNAVGEHG